MEQNRMALEWLNIEPENSDRALKAICKMFENLSEWKGTEANR